MPVRWKGDAATFARDLDQLPRWAEAAAILGLERTSNWVLAETFEPIEATRALHVERLGELARVLSGFGIRLGLEVIGVESFRTGAGQTFVARFEDLGPLWHAIRAAAPGAEVGVLLDAWHLYAAGEPMSIEAGRVWGLRVADVVWVHLADLPPGATPDRHVMLDGERGLPGEHGAIDSRGLLRELAALGYRGPVTAEPMPGCRSLLGLAGQPEAVAHRVASSLRSVWPNDFPGS